MGRLYDLIQAHMEAQRYDVSVRQVAKDVGVTQTTLTNWKTPKALPDKKHLEAISRVTGVPYIRVLDAALEDIGYIPEARPETRKTAEFAEDESSAGTA